MPNAKTMSKASTARIMHRRHQMAVSQITRDHLLEELEHTLGQAIAHASGTLTRPIGGPRKADHVTVYGFDDSSMLIIPGQGPAYVAKNRHDHEHFGRMLDEQSGWKAASPIIAQVLGTQEEGK